MKWIEHKRLFTKAGMFPTDEDLIVQVKFRNGKVSRPTPVKAWRWWRFPNQSQRLDHDIVAWRKV